MAAFGPANSVVDAELPGVKEKLASVEGVEVITCVAAQVRVHIKKTEYKQLTVCMQFPENYPHDPIITELKSKTLADRLIDGLQKVCDEEAKKMCGATQVVHMVKFIKGFLDDTSLSVCSEEIHHLRRKVIDPNTDEMKLKQKTSQIIFKIIKNKYYMNFRVSIPEDYPSKQALVDVTDTNYPQTLRTYFQAQSVEVGRQCVQKPLKQNPKAPPFQPSPSLRPICDFLITESIKRYPIEKCPLCHQQGMPPNPEDCATQMEALDRVYCGHIFHHKCLDKYMKTPPFAGGKMCPSCGNRIYHEKFKITPELAERRWAHKEARARELEEVVDFLQ